ncbi:MAG: hypothetical protein ACI4TK_01940 [Agathobacter sp.]
MKRQIILLTVIIFLFTGCSAPKQTDESTQPRDGIVEHIFSSYEELEEWFQPDTMGNIPAEADLSKGTKRYDKLVNDMTQGNIHVMKAYFGEERIPFREEACVRLFASDQIDYWTYILYNYSVNNNKCLIQVTYLTQEEIDYAKRHTINEFVKYFSPTEINLDDWRFDTVKNVSVESFALSDRTVSALCIEQSIPNSIKLFIYDDMYIVLEGHPEVFESEIWETFSLRED